MHGNPDDGATLAGALVQTQHLTIIKPKQAAVDKGFRGAYHPKDVQVVVAGTRQRTTPLKQFLKPRNAIEPITGHTK